LAQPDHLAEQRALELELLRQHDGAERIPYLPLAQLVTVTPLAREDDPTAVEIVWGPGSVERPAPRASLWRAALQRYLAEPESADPADAILRAQVGRSLERYPDLETYWHWLRTGWTARPAVPRRRRR
jgi:hypothetical protein